ncbi:MAG: BatA domain-containing protein [Pirellulaceae bacterium]
MNLFPALAAWQFAAAGAVCAAIPLLIHLLNRRRYRVVPWAAMQFLAEAVRQRQRVLRLRDWLLLLVRTLAVALFGLALARPYFAVSGDPARAGAPIHAVLLVDNSLSMGVRGLGGTRLDEAKRRAVAFVEQLPAGSAFSVVATCEPPDPHSVPFESVASAVDALTRIELADRGLSVRDGLPAWRRLAVADTVRAAHLVLFTDLQEQNWQELDRVESGELPPLTVVDVAGESTDNSCVARLEVADDVVDGTAPTTIVAEIRHHGTMPRRAVRVALSIDEREVDSQSIELGPGGTVREVVFRQSLAAFRPEAGVPTFVPVKVTLSGDRLVEDDARYLLVPVVGAWPIVFVDQYGADQERPALGRFGETRHLRQLLITQAGSADRASRPGRALGSGGPRHVRLEQLDRNVLADARVVVLAGLASPADKVDLLRDFVVQGGQLLIAAGGDFDAAAWNAAAWREGDGVLPLPLSPVPLGAASRPGESDFAPLRLDYDSFLRPSFWQLAGNSDSALRELYEEPLFFRAVTVQDESAVRAELDARIGQQLARKLSDSDKAAHGGLTVAAAKGPTWLNWQPPPSAIAWTLPGLESDAEERRRWVDTAQETLRPRVLARYGDESGSPFLASRRVGEGSVWFVSSGLLSPWNTLPNTNAIVMFDRLLRGLLQSTLSIRNHAPVDQLAVPIPGHVRGQRVVLQRPGGGIPEALDTGYVRPNQLGVVIPRPLVRGFYRLQTAENDAAGGGTRVAAERWQYDVALNGAASESDLKQLGSPALAAAPWKDRWRLRGTASTLNASDLEGNRWDATWWLALAVLLLLLTESLLTARRSGGPIAGRYRSGVLVR